MELIFFEDKETNKLVGHTLSPEVRKVMKDLHDCITEERDGWLTKYPKFCLRVIALAFEKDGERKLEITSAPMDIFEDEFGERSLKEIWEKMKYLFIGELTGYKIVGAWDITESYHENWAINRGFFEDVESAITGKHKVQNYGLITKENREDMELIRCTTSCVVVKVAIASVDGDEILEFLVDESLEAMYLGFSSCLYMYEQVIKDEVVKAIKALNKRIIFITTMYY